MNECLFCKIVNKDIPAEIIIENDKIIAFKDINPTAPVHILIVPKKHISTINDLKEEDSGLIAEMILTAKTVAKNNGLDNSGYRLVFNVGEDGGQEVLHIHLHLIGGRQMVWPPG